jgi:ferredoxin-NADP reductase
VLLIYANRKEADITFRTELESMQSDGFPVLRTVHVLTEPSAAWKGPTGQVNVDSLRLHCGGLSEKTFFICCPPVMTSELIRALRRAGVAPFRIHADYFGL